MTMQGRQVSVDYTWIGSTHLRRRLLLVGEPTKIQQFIATLKATFTLKHVTTASKEQDVRFLGKRLQLHDDNSISISLEPSY